MLASILIGVAAVIAVSLAAALLLFAHLTGRIRRPVALGAAAAAVTVGGTLAAAGIMGCRALGPMALPFGMFLVLAAGINGLLAYRSPRSAAPPE